MQIKCKMSTPDTQNNNNFLILITKLFSAIITVGHISTIWKKDLLYQCIKEDQRHRINMNRTDLLHFYVLFPNCLRRLYSQEFNIGLKHFQLYYQTSSSMDSPNLKNVLQRF